MVDPWCRLHVEGKDDYRALFHFLATRQLDATAPWFPEIKEAGDVDRLLSSIDIAIRFGTGQTVGSCWMPTHRPATVGERSQGALPTWD